MAIQKLYQNIVMQFISLLRVHKVLFQQELPEVAPLCLASGGALSSTRARVPPCLTFGHRSHSHRCTREVGVLSKTDQPSPSCLTISVHVWDLPLVACSCHSGTSKGVSWRAVPYQMPRGPGNSLQCQLDRVNHKWLSAPL